MTSPPPPARTPAVRGLGDDLAAAGWTVDGVGALLGPVAQAALARESPVPAVRALRGRGDAGATLTRLWLLGRAVTRRELDAALPVTGAQGAVALGLVEAAGHEPDDELRPLVDLRPHEYDGTTWWLASDLSELVTGVPLEPDHVLGVGGASVTLSRWVPRRHAERALDVGTGCGVQAFHLARHSAAVVATDVSARCLAFAGFNAALNGRALAGTPVELRHGSLLEPVAGERFDLVVSNPPFVITPRAPGVPAQEYRDGGLVGDALVRGLVGSFADVLGPGGVGQLLGNWELADGEDWRDRVRSWLPPGLDAWVVQREHQDPAEYAETWARDGGHRPGEPAHTALLEAWLDDFAARGVTGIGFGVITVRRPDGDPGGPLLRRLDDLPGPLGGGGPLGQTVADVLAAHDWLRTHDDQALTARRLVLAGDVTEERFGRPGDEDPQLVLLRQGGGLQRAVRADTALAGLVGACDGELTVGVILDALGRLLDEPVGELSARLLPAVRGLVADGLLLPA